MQSFCIKSNQYRTSCQLGNADKKQDLVRQVCKGQQPIKRKIMSKKNKLFLSAGCTFLTITLFTDFRYLLTTYINVDLHAKIFFLTNSLLNGVLEK